MIRKERYDVLVVGARCAGAATAMLMARRGLRVLAVDKGDYGTDTMSTHALMRGGVLQLHRWGLLPRIVEMATPAVRSTSFHYGDEQVRVDIKPSHGIDALYAPRRTVLDRILVDAAQEAGATIRYRHVLAGLRRDLDGRVTGGVLRGADGAMIEVQADLVVGADGLGSAVARLVDAAVRRSARHTSVVIFGYWAGLAPDGYHWHYRPNASAGVIPTNDDQHCIFAAVPGDRFRQTIRHDVAGGYHRVLAEAAPDLAARLEPGRLDGRLIVFAGRKGFLRQPWGPGWALVGDAGYFKDPLTAHGITDALRDAEILADAAAGGTDRDLAAYAEVRDHLSQPLFSVTDEIASFDWDVDGVRAHHAVLNQAMKREVAYLATLDAGDATHPAPSPAWLPAGAA